MRPLKRRPGIVWIIGLVAGIVCGALVAVGIAGHAMSRTFDGGV